MGQTKSGESPLVNEKVVNPKIKVVNAG